LEKLVEDIYDITLINHSTSMTSEIIVKDGDGEQILWLYNYQLKQLSEALEKIKELL
jgi:hypothetical protein